MRRIALLCLISSCVAVENTMDSPLPTSRRDQAELRDRFTRERFETVLPELMREQGIELWALFAREYNEDPALKTMLPAEWYSARRTTMLLLFAEDESVERVAVSRYPVGEFFESAWKPEEVPDQWKALADLVEERDPRSIALNVSPTSALADGLSASLFESTIETLPTSLRERVKLEHELPIRWLETRTAGELEMYPALVGEAHRLILDGFDWITPGETSTDELAWWYEDAIQRRGYETWFHPLVSVQRSGRSEGDLSFANELGKEVIQPGDLIHIDLGLVWAGLHTDTQHQAYVLRVGESDAPAGILEGYVVGNGVQDDLMAEYAVGRTGNEVLLATRKRLEAKGIDGKIYTHPLGLHGHAAGPLIGLWDQQNGVAGRGEFRVNPNTCWAIELGLTHPVDEWGGQPVEILLEEDAWFDGEVVRFLDGRLVRPTLVGTSGGVVRSGLSARE